MVKNKKLLLIISILINIIFVQITSASVTLVEPITPKTLPSQLHEEEEINFTIKIKDYDYENANILRLETNLIKSDNRPLYDFGELNEYLNVNRYEQSIILNISSLPQKAFIEVSVNGKAPNGENKIMSDKSDIVITKFTDSNLKLYEVYIDEKLEGIETFKLIIDKKEKFEKTMQQIDWNELNSLKSEIRKLFDIGLVIEAQSLATHLSNIERPDNLLLLKIIKIKNNFWLNITFLSSLFISFIFGYWYGSKPSEED